MVLSVHNTLSRSKERFEPIDPPRVGMYVCGLTVYDHAHIGHARTAVAFEVIRRWLKHRGFQVVYVENVTDVDDKIIARAKELGRDPAEHAAEWARICDDQMRRLGLPGPDVQPKVTQHMEQIRRLVARLLEAGAAYRADDGSVYLSVGDAANYGRLSNQSPDDLLAGARVDPAEGKKDPRDFALWKAAKPDEPSWSAPWGDGRPGWHIECSAMSMTYLGESFDIHGGGVDLVFPHHENEIAQSESATGKPFVKYWLHSGFLSVGGEKMSKSLKNFVTIDHILKTTDPEAIRFFYANTHYRSKIDFTSEAIAEAARGLERLRRVKQALNEAAAASDAEDAGDAALQASIDRLEKEFGVAMDDDFNTRGAVAALFDAVTAINKALEVGVSASAAASAADVFTRLAHVLTVFQSEPAAVGDVDHAASDALIDLLLGVRETARADSQFAISDAIRDGLAKLGVKVSDTKEGPTWRRSG